MTKLSDLVTLITKQISLTQDLNEHLNFSIPQMLATIQFRMPCRGLVQHYTAISKEHKDQAKAYISQGLKCHTCQVASNIGEQNSSILIRKQVSLAFETDEYKQNVQCQK